MAWWKDYDERDTREGKGWLDKGIQDVMIRGHRDPDEAAQIVLDRLDALAEAKRVPYLPDEPDDTAGLYVEAHLEATRLIRLLKAEGYSERSRETLSNVLKALSRFEASAGLEQYVNPDRSVEYGHCVDLLRSFCHFTRFRIQKQDGEYEAALSSLSHGIGYFKVPYFKVYLTDEEDADQLLNDFSMTDSVPWLGDFHFQEAVDCLEALRARGHANDPEGLAAVCEQFADESDEPWIRDREPTSISDAEDNYWESASGYWQYALGWAEAQLRPAELQDLLHRRDDEAAQQRLRAYFFGDDIWARLPERAKRSLVSADHDWLSGTNIRTESILNELKIAAEEVLLHGLWRPLEQWIEHSGEESGGSGEFLTLKRELSVKRWQPDMAHFEKVCKMPMVSVFLRERGVASDDQDWLAQELPDCLSRLRQIRSRAEHASSNRWTRKGIHQYVAELLGIGRPGVLPRLAKLLL